MFIFHVIFVAFFVFANTHQDEKALDWWQTSIIYQIYPRSFKDSNSDGVGDLKGIEEKAEYLKDLGVGTVWLSPIYKSPMADMGYDISDFKAIDPIFGTMDHFESLKSKLHSLGMKLTLDFVPNHSSDEHEWFVKSVEKIDPYTNYYVWKDPKGWINETTPIPPNNWIGPFEESTWTFHPKRKQFYMHQFATKQPDLNYRCPELVEEMNEVLRFWLNKGVDGFRMDAVIFLIEEENFLDEPIISDKVINGKPAFIAFDHIYTQNQPETYEIFRGFRKTLDSYAKKDGQTRLIMTEAYTDIKNTMKWYGNQSHPIAQIPFNFFLLNTLNDTSNSNDFKNAINIWMENMPEGEWPNWVLGNHDNPRIADRFDPISVDAINMLLLLLPGTPITFNGEEIGMEGAKIRWDQTTDVGGLNVGPALYRTISRDPERSPFQWDNSSHAGFSETKEKTWLPVNPNYYRINVQTQLNNPRSHYNVYKELSKLRSNAAFRVGDFKSYAVSERVFAFKRSLQSEVYLIILNLDNEVESVDIKGAIADVTHNFKVILVSGNSEYNVGDTMNTASDPFMMRPKSALILQEIPE